MAISTDEATPASSSRPAFLAQLSARIQVAHEAAQAGARTALENAILCGELLLQAKRAVGHGSFLPWLAAHTTLGPRQAQRYMRVARHREALSNASSETHLTAAVGLLAEPREGAGEPPGGPPPLPWTGEYEWYTPRTYVEAARTVMGRIDLDPASSLRAQETVKAAEYFTRETDGLARPWRGRVWLNPPYRADLIAAFVRRLLDEHTVGRVPEAVLLTHSRTDTDWFHAAAARAAALCFTRGRIRFAGPEGTGESPTSGSVFLYFGARSDRFAATFGDIGLVLRGYGPAGRSRRPFLEAAA